MKLAVETKCTIFWDKVNSVKTQKLESVETKKLTAYSLLRQRKWTVQSQRWQSVETRKVEYSDKEHSLFRQRKDRLFIQCAQSVETKKVNSLQIKRGQSIPTAKLAETEDSTICSETIIVYIDVHYSRTVRQTWFEAAANDVNWFSLILYCKGFTRVIEIRSRSWEPGYWVQIPSICIEVWLMLPVLACHVYVANGFTKIL